MWERASGESMEVFSVQECQEEDGGVSRRGFRERWSNERGIKEQRKERGRKCNNRMEGVCFMEYLISFTSWCYPNCY